MGYVVCHRVTYRVLFDGKEFPTERGAKIALTRACNRDGLYPADYRVMDRETFDLEEPMVERVNMMSGEVYMEKVNTPPHLSPACETYWSM